MDQELIRLMREFFIAHETSKPGPMIHLFKELGYSERNIRSVVWYLVDRNELRLTKDRKFGRT